MHRTVILIRLILPARSAKDARENRKTGCELYHNVSRSPENFAECNLLHAAKMAVKAEVPPKKQGALLFQINVLNVVYGVPQELCTEPAKFLDGIRHEETKTACFRCLSLH